MPFLTRSSQTWEPDVRLTPLSALICDFFSSVSPRSKMGLITSGPEEGKTSVTQCTHARGRLVKGEGQQHSLVPDLFSLSQSPFQGLPPPQAPLEEVPRCLKNQVGQIKPGLKGFCSHLHNLRKFRASYSKTESSTNKCLNHIPLHLESALHWCVQPVIPRSLVLPQQMCLKGLEKDRPNDI